MLTNTKQLFIQTKERKRHPRPADTPLEDYRVDTINYKDSFPALCRCGKVVFHS